MSKPFVYIASPYTKGDPTLNTHFQCQMWNDMMDSGAVLPFAPLLTHFQHFICPRPYQDWIDYDLALIERIDALIRLNAYLPQHNYFQSESSGADGEVEHMRSLGRPVFFHLEDLYDWAGSLQNLNETTH